MVFTAFKCHYGNKRRFTAFQLTVFWPFHGQQRSEKSKYRKVLKTGTTVHFYLLDYFLRSSTNTVPSEAEAPT